MTADAIDTASVIKQAKKSLKKKNDSSMKIKSLTKKIVDKLELKNVNNSDKLIQQILEKCDHFAIEGKVISIQNQSGSSSKRKLENFETYEESSPSSKKVKKSSKKVKKGEEKENKKKSPPVSTSNSDDISKWRKEHKIVLKVATDDVDKDKKINEDPNYFPFQSFDSPKCKAQISSALIHQCTVVNKFIKPSPIQAQCWPVLSSSSSSYNGGRDVVGIAETGSGKTLAFAIPALTSMHNEDQAGKREKQGRLPRMLVLAPTRELAMQSHEVLKEFGSIINLQSLVVYGGVPKHQQTSALRKGVDCIVATPGRLKDLINDYVCDLSQISNLVLDEADRMLDMGFEEDVRYIISQCRDKSNRQTAMFSATWPASIQKLAMEYMTDPIRVYVGFEAIVGSNGENNIDDSLSANKRVTQTIEVIEDRARDARLRELLKKYHGKRNNRVLIFALYKKEAQRLENNLRREGWKCCSIHGDKGQDARTRALADFKDGTNPLMIATDVAARGLDIPNVEVVLNFTFPLTIEDYVHRIGR